MANKALGQHWLNNREILDKIADLAVVPGVETCLEIGPGLGTLTSSLLKRFKRVVAVEYDEELARKLPGSFPGTNLEVVNQDILQFDFKMMGEEYVVAGNIPYYITGAIIEKVLTRKPQPKKVVLLIQKEVAERIKGERKESILSLSVKNRAEIELGPVVLRDEFTPSPEVDSQVIILKPHSAVFDHKVMKLIGLAFSEPRKKVTKNLSLVVPRNDLAMMFVRMNINVDARAEDIRFEQWQAIYDGIVKIMSN